MFNISKVASKFYTPGRRAISLSCANRQAQDYYSILGIKRNATQSEIKNAYYNLSLKLHPDTNKGSEETAEQFRLVTNAYEVLGNLKLRKLYDRGALHGTPKLASPPPVEPEEPLDKDTKHRFYAAYAKYSRNQNAASSHYAGQKYDFDSWTKTHYTNTFKNSQTETRSKFTIKDEARFVRTHKLKVMIGWIVINICTWFMWEDLYGDVEENARNFKPIVVEKFYH